MRVLQLDNSWRPVDLIGVHDAVAKIAMGKAQAIEIDEGTLYRGPVYEDRAQLVIPRPIVIQVPNYVELRPYAKKYVVRRVLYARDKWVCQYCATKLDRATATCDHVKPLSKGGTHTWDNVVTACKPCNHRKADRLPWEAGMPLIDDRAPKAPHFVQTAFAGKLEPIQKEYVARYYPRVDISLL
jgi:5-methylcytosine-specific restriction endonuclease McrA